MAEIERYARLAGSILDKRSDGGWVRYSDYDQPASELQALRDAVAEEVWQHEVWAEGDRNVAAYLRETDKAAEAVVYDETARSHETAFVRLVALLDPPHKDGER